MKSLILILLLTLSFSVAHATQKVIDKASVLRGESFVTANTNPEDVESILKNALSQKGYEVINEVNSNEEVFYVDFFVFQFPADFPTVSITIRSESGIHFFDKESVRLFGDRNSANLKLASKIAERLPTNINTGLFYEVTLNDLLSNNRISIIGLTSNAIMKGYRANYSSEVNWFENEPPHFIVPDAFNNYFALSSNYQGIRKQLKGKEITLKLNINQKARFEIVDIDSPIDLNEKQKSMLTAFVNSFPLWTIRNPIENIEMKIGVK